DPTNPAHEIHEVELLLRWAFHAGEPPSVPLFVAILIATMALVSCCCAQQSIPAAAVVPGGMVIPASGSVRLAIISRVLAVSGSDSPVLSQVRYKNGMIMDADRTLGGPPTFSVVVP